MLPFSEGHLGGRGRAAWGEPGQEAPGGARAGPASRVPTCPGSRISGTTSSVSSTVANSPESFKLFTRTRCLGRVCARACALCLHAARLGGRSRGVALTPPPPAGGPGDSQEWEGPAAQQGAWMGGSACELGWAVGLPSAWPSCLVLEAELRVPRQQGGWRGAGQGWGLGVRGSLTLHRLLVLEIRCFLLLLWGRLQQGPELQTPPRPR